MGSEETANDLGRLRIKLVRTDEDDRLTLCCCEASRSLCCASASAYCCGSFPLHNTANLHTRQVIDLPLRLKLSSFSRYKSS